MDELMTSSDEESSLSSGSSELFSIGASYDVCRNPPQADSLSSEEVRSREILVRALLDADYDTLESLGPDALTTELHIMTRCACFVSPCSCYCSRAVEGLCNNIVTKSEFFEAITTGTCQPFHVDCVEIPHKLVGVVSQVIPKTIAELPSTYWASVWPIHIAVLVNNVELVQWILTRIKGKLVKPTICKDATTQQGNSANESKDTEDSYTQTPAQEHEGAHLALHDDAMDTSSSVPFYREETSENKRAKLAPDCCDRSDAANKDGAPVSALEVGTGNLGFTPLHLACFIRAADIVRLLLQNGAQVNVQSHATRQTPCAVAVTNMTKPGFVLRNEVIRILIEYGADINMGVDDAPIMKAVQCGDLQLVRTLVAAGVNQDISRFSPSTLLQRVQSSIRLFKVGMALLEGDALVNARSSDGNTPLQNALSAGDPFDQPLHQERLAFMRRLLEKGANPNDNDMPPLILALFTRLPEEAKLLLQFGANPQGKDRNGYQALHAAAWEGHTEICRLLIDKGFIPLTQVLIQMSRNTIQANNNNRKGSKDRRNGVGRKQCLRKLQRRRLGNTRICDS